MIAFGGFASAKVQVPPTTLAITSGVSTSSPVVPFAVSNHDFEVSEGFATGVLSGQNGWTAFAASTVMPTVDAVNPSSGSQHMHLENDPASGGLTNIGGFSPLLAPQSATDSSRVSVDIFISNDGGSDYDVVAQAPSLGTLTWRVKFEWLGNINVVDDIGGGLAFIDTGIVWPIGTYFNLEVITDPVANSIEYYIDGNLIYTSVIGLIAAPNVEQVVLLNDNFQLAGETADFDNLQINTFYLAPPTPVPSLGVYAVILLMLSLLVVMRRQYTK